mmetsp:Transcript_30686/g.42499  ORF Transcript_30686/g.42499 Transcript_30686/m.42499 type:complete len:563 (-) Transcript_30686:189-1877(-)|eukprot:CAMPEP_0196585120 /NCGR_PEP_ID=MMETSP1081-20130531/49582_1 /TAXON_ID=36882 /ORGANISM="Pyramimonas amylifera, Strain CCMP720" /LENGTH=562 /DNA_ID=CAMNT_0041906567 /DNA_START=169 /DNA_END=1857 /DNA_ORIENTATION=+
MGGGNAPDLGVLNETTTVTKDSKENAFSNSGMISSLKLTSLIEFASVGFEQTVLTALVSICAPSVLPDENTRAPVYLTSVADRSGSMEGAKLETMKSALKFLSRQLTSSDMFGLVSYSSDVREDQTLIKCESKEVLENVKKAIDSMRAGSSTNLSGGLLEGITQHHTSAKKEEANKKVESLNDVVRGIFLFTDGLANEGVLETDKLVACVLGALTEVVGSCSIFCFGLGSDHDEGMLSALAEATGGHYYYLENEENIPAAFADALGGLLSVFAQNIKVLIRPLNGAEITKVQTKFEHQKLGDGSVSINLHDLYCEESRDLVLEIMLPPIDNMKQEDGAHGAARKEKPENIGTEKEENHESLQADGDGERYTAPFEVELIYFSLSQHRQMRQTIQAPAVGRKKAGTHAQANGQVQREVQKHKLRVQAAEAIQEAVKTAEKGDIQTSRALLTRTIEQYEMSETVACGDEFSMNIMRDLETASGNMNNYSSFAKHKKAMFSSAVSHQMQRSAAHTMEAGEDRSMAVEGNRTELGPSPGMRSFQLSNYTTSSKANMISKAEKYFAQ